MSRLRGLLLYLVQGEHGEHGAVVGLDGLQQGGFLPDVHVARGGAREHQLVRTSVAHGHHALQLPQVPKHPSSEGETPAWEHTHTGVQLCSTLTGHTAEISVENPAFLGTTKAVPNSYLL